MTDASNRSSRTPNDEVLTVPFDDPQTKIQPAPALAEDFGQLVTVPPAHFFAAP